MAKDYKCKKCGNLVSVIPGIGWQSALKREKLCQNCYAKKHRQGKYAKRRANMIANPWHKSKIERFLYAYERLHAKVGTIKKDSWDWARGVYKSQIADDLAKNHGVTKKSVRDYFTNSPEVKRTKSNPDTNLTGLSVVLIVTAAVYFGWCGYNYYQTKEWSWAPWTNLNLGLLNPETLGLKEGKIL